MFNAVKTLINRWYPVVSFVCTECNKEWQQKVMHLLIDEVPCVHCGSAYVLHNIAARQQ